MSETTTNDVKEEIRQALLPRRLEIIHQHSAWIRRHEDRVIEHVIDGDQLDVANISPYLEECRTENDHAFWRYLRYNGAIPYSEYVGRRQRFLIRDAGHPSNPIMGIAALGSSIMQLRVRDHWIGWQVDTTLTEDEEGARRNGVLSYKEALALRRARRERNKELREVKKSRIATIADLYVSQAVPPYNELTAGKLLCLMMLSNEVRELFQRKYAGRKTQIAQRESTDLALIVTTSVFGLRTSLYNRLRYRKQLAYIPVGETVGFGTAQISDAIFTEMREFLAIHGKEPSHVFGSGSNWRMRVIRSYHDLKRKLAPDHAEDGESALRHGQRRGVFVAPLACNARAYLTGEEDALCCYDWPLQDLVSWWQERWLRTRIENPEVMARVRAFRKEDFRISRLLNDIEQAAS